MKAYFVLLAAFAPAFGLLLSVPARAENATSKRFEPAQLRADFRIARQSLEEGHSGLYRYTKKAELDRIFDETEQSLDHAMDLYEFYRAMAPMIAAIKCGHTDLSMPADVEVELQRLPQLSFDIKVLDSKAYIFRDYAKSGMLAGKEIRSINGVPTTHIISTMLAAESQDGDGQASRQRNIGRHFGLNLITLLGLRAPYTVVLGGGAGNKDVESVQIAGLSRDDLNKMSKTLFPQDQPKTHFAELRFLDSGQIARLTYSSFGTSSEEGQKFMRQAFEGIQSKGSKALILDLRGNGGGEDELGKLLFSYLFDAPFEYYDDLIINGMNFSFSKYTDNHADLTVPAGVAQRRADGRVHVIDHPNLGLQQPSNPIFTGPVYILIDGGCFSTTAEFLTEVHSHHRATFIGEESAGGYYGNTSGSVVRIILPNTKLRVFIPLMTYYMSVGGKHEHEAARGVIPDFPVRHTIADLEAGVDRDFELALDLARKSR